LHNSFILTLDMGGFPIQGLLESMDQNYSKIER
jgi:hypothetical protein